MIPLDTESLEITKRKKTKPNLPRVIMLEFMEVARLLVSNVRVFNGNIPFLRFFIGRL